LKKYGDLAPPTNVPTPNLSTSSSWPHHEPVTFCIVRDLSDDEQRAKACITAALSGASVEQLDDGSRPGLCDLKLSRDDEVVGVVEVTAAADGQLLALQKLVPRGWREPNLTGDWMVTVLPSARNKTLRRELPVLLRDLESNGATALCLSDDLTCDHAARLRVIAAHQNRPGSPGNISVTVEPPAERSGAIVPSTGDGLADWLGRWVREPDQSDNLRKLAHSTATERHLFVLIPGSTTAPFTATYVLVRDTGPLPTFPVSLPPEITEIWVMSTWDRGDGFRWSQANGWQRFSKVCGRGCLRCGCNSVPTAQLVPSSRHVSTFS
jgi:hypothetical protein